MALPPNFLGDLIASTQGGTIEPQAASNAMGIALGGTSPGALPTAGLMTAQQAGPAPVAAAPRSRRSILDIVGGIADTLATVGGATPLYQPGIDARRDRNNAEEDRAYQIEQRPLERQMIDQKLKRGEQEISAGALDIQNANNELLNSAGAGMRQVFGRSGAEGVLKAWPLLAKNLGVRDDKAAEIGQALASDPEGTLAALFPDPAVAKGGSKAKEIQLYELMAAKDPAAADAYLTSLSDPNKPMTPYQAAQLANADREYERKVYEYDNPKPTAAQRNAGAKTGVADEARAASAQAANATLDELSGLYDQLDEIGAMVNPKKGTAGNIAARARASGLGQLVEGAVGTQAQELRDRVESIRPGLMQQLAKATGMTGKQLDSNADVKLFMQTVTDPTRSYEANQAAIRGIRRLLSSPPPRPAARAAPPARRPGAPERKPAPVVRVINGKRYEQRGGKWFEAQ